LISENITLQGDIKTSCIQNQTCTAIGGSCKADCHIKDGNCCPIPNKCINSKCTIIDKDVVGISCKNITDCYQYAKKSVQLEYLQCVNGKCQIGAMINDQCTKNSDCWGNLKCNDGKCAGVKIGGACSPSPYYDNLAYYQECEWNAFCYSNKCVARISDGSKCNLYSLFDRCMHGSFCHVSNTSQDTGNCVPKYSLPENSYCGDDSWCKNGLVCDYNSVCKMVPTWNIQSCTSDSDCPKDLTCECDYFVGKGFCNNQIQNRQPCTTKDYDFYQCLESNHCTKPQLLMDKNTCSYQDCQTLLLSAMSCFYCEEYPKILGNCIYCPLSFWQKILVWGLWKFILVLLSSVIGVSIIILSVVVLIFKCKKKRHGYVQVN